MMLLYDTADSIAGRPRKFTPLTDEQYEQRCEAFNSIVGDYKKRVRLAMGNREARHLEKSVLEFIDRNAYTDIDFESWKLILNAVLCVSCQHMISSKIKYTPNKYRHEWTAEELDKMIEICGIDEQGRYYIFRDANLACKAPECMARHGYEDVVPQRTQVAATGA
ncbi:MAG: hypothetical protein LUH14_05920 [Clostridiaceae bacterium]|nr:hypothetical protein [Clostridiaceae bacterium]